MLLFQRPAPRLLAVAALFLVIQASPLTHVQAQSTPTLSESSSQTSNTPAPPAPPAPPVLQLDPDPHPPSQPPSHPPSRGTPVTPLTPGQVPARWLYAGPFPNPDTQALAAGDADPPDPLAPLGGPEHARPRLGDAAALGNVVRRFQPLSPRHVEPGGINIADAVGRVDDSITYYYTLLAVTRTDVQTLRVRLDDDHGVDAWLDGHRIREGDLVRLAPGLHRLLVRAAIREVRHPWSALLMSPRLEALRPDNIEPPIDADARE